MIRLKSLLFEQAGYNWNSCKAWRNSGGTSYWNGEEGRPKITTKANDVGFYLQYEGRGSGYAIAHANNSKGDSLHQAFTVVMCECNPFLMKGGLKPDVNNIQTNCSLESAQPDIYNLNIWIPFIKMDDAKIYQVARRGGWGHTGGKSELPAPGSLPDYEGPVTVVTSTGRGNITEYFIAFSIKDKPITQKTDLIATNTINAKKTDKGFFKVSKSKEVDKKTVSTHNKGTESPSSSSQPTDDWYKYTGDDVYVYQQRDGNWHAKNIATSKDFNIQQSKYQKTLDRLDAAKAKKTLIKV